MKVKINDKKLWKNYLKWVSGTAVPISMLLAFVDFCQKTKLIIGISYLVLLAGLFIVLWCVANKKTSVSLKINNSTVNIFYGDIFAQKGYKVIAFNEYFDTIVDDRLISENSLNGQYIKNYVADVSALDRLIIADRHIKEPLYSITNTSKKHGKKTKYHLGVICKNGDYFLLAFSHFDEQYRANLTLQDYTACLMKMWSEIDALYGGKTVSIPLLGSGITRFKDCEISDQELLEIIIWTLKISKVKFTYPSTMNIVLSESRKDKINLYKLKEETDNE